MSADRVAFAPRLVLTKDEVFDICGAAARCEALLRRSGWTTEADRVLSLIGRLEGRLAEPAGQPSAQASVGASPVSWS